MAGFSRGRTELPGLDTQPRTRRFSPRARVSGTVWARAGQQRMRFHTVDIGPRGARLRPTGIFPVGAALQLEFITPDGQRLPVSGVVWRTDADGMAILFLGTVPTGFDGLGHRI
jgi:hypothetical protein